MARQENLRRLLPSVDEVLRSQALIPHLERFGRATLSRAVREVLDDARATAARGDEAALAEALGSLESRIVRRVDEEMAPSLRRVINATGVVIHTNLGRAPLSGRAAERMALLSSSYSNLEYDLERGERGSRDAHSELRLRRLLGVEASLVVNNNAAAVLLAVNSLAEGAEVIVSRGELVEIGGSFRIPDVLRKGGARLVEVGTTNKTRIEDYEGAFSPATALLLRVHRSNFAILGFTESPALQDLVRLAREKKVPLVEDQGSGLLFRHPPPLEAEGSVSESLAAGVDLVAFSGDKLLGGPQAGLVVGRRDLVDTLKRNPLYRALRVDKVTLAAIDAVLMEYEADRALAEVPVARMLRETASDIRPRAEVLRAAIAAECPTAVASLVEGLSAVGGGAAPTAALPTVLVAVSHPSLGPDRLAERLRNGDPPVVARVADGQLLLDLRTVLPGEEGALQRSLAIALHAPRG